jgi:hypothetical protein
MKGVATRHEGSSLNINVCLGETKQQFPTTEFVKMSQKGKERIVVFFLLLCAIGFVRGQDNKDSSEAPQITRCTPGSASVGTVLDIEGYRLGALSLEKVRAHFIQGKSDYIATLCGSEGENVNDEQGQLQHLEANVPEGLILGLCQVIVEVDGRRSVPITIEITPWKPPEITAISPPWAQPGEHVSFDGSGFHITDDIVLIDARGRKHQFEPGGAATYSGQKIPDDLPEGEATLYIVNRDNPGDPPSRSFKLQVSHGPVPLDIWPAELMPVAPGQWLDLIVTTLKPLERAERAEVAFQQSGQLIISPVVNHASPRVQVPRRLRSGEVTLLTRTWQGSKASSWSEPVLYQLTRQPVTSSVEVIEIESPDKSTYVYLGDGPDRPQKFKIRPGGAMKLQGTFPVASVDRLQVILERFGRTLTLKPIALESPGIMKIVLPDDLPPGDWQISVLSLDDDVTARLPIAMHIE